jgi:hypothetical protein
MLRMLKIYIVTMLLCFFAGSVAYAANDCYSPYEAEAEQGIRIHSELMVIGLNCMHLTPPGHQNFYVTYKQFTAKNQDLFVDYEGALINHFKKTGVAKPEGALNDLRTNFANRISKDAASMRPDIFCARYVDRLRKVSAMDRTKFRKWAGTIYPSHPVSRPVCQ